MHLLLVVPEAPQRWDHLCNLGHRVVAVGSASEALRHAAEHPVDVAIVDLDLPEGPRLAQQLRALPSRVGVLVLSSEPSAKLELLHAHGGRNGYLVKPAAPEDVARALTRVAEYHTVVPPAGAPSLDDWRRLHAPELIGRDPKLLRVLEVMRRVATSDCSVLITGETGTGKELVARALHRGSARTLAPFIAVNCAAIPESLMESELFGHARGAFTGAHQAHKGHFASANGGTMLLDEIGEMPLSLQAKLLRVLQEGEIHPVGEPRPTKVDVRVVSATHRDLESMIDAGTFREDLLYRLELIRIELPPLRARRGDIPELIASFVLDASRRRGRPPPRLDEHALEALSAYDWPGNVRQLQHCVERLILLSTGSSIVLDDLPQRVRDARPSAGEPPRRLATSSPELPQQGLDLRDAVERFENALILQALERTGWNKNQAAAMLHLNRTTLVEKLKKKRLSSPDV